MKELESYIRLLKLDPDAKYMLIVSRDSGLSYEDLCSLKLADQFVDEILFIQGNVHELVRHVQITKKEKK